MSHIPFEDPVAPGLALTARWGGVVRKLGLKLD